MHKASLFSFLSLLPALAAQVPPAIVKTEVGDASRPPHMTALGATNIGHGVTEVVQLEARPISGGLFRLAATVRGLHGQMGGAGGLDVLEAVYDPTAGTVTVQDWAKNLNTAGDEICLTISRDGLRAVVAQPSGCVWASRTATNSVFGAASAVTGLPSGTTAYCDPKLFLDYRGADNLAFVDATGSIASGRFTAGVVSAIEVRAPKVAGALTAHSPEPIYGASGGDVMAWIYACSFAAGDSDSYWLPDRKAGVNQPQRIWDTADTQAHPTGMAASATTYWSYRDSAAYHDPTELALVATTGLTNFSVSGHNNLLFRTWVPYSNSSWVAALAFGVSSAPVAIPGVLGNSLATTPSGTRPAGLLGLLPTPLVILSGTAPALAGGVSFSVHLMPGTIPAGVPVDMQAVGLDLASGQSFLGNTAKTQGN